MTGRVGTTLALSALAAVGAGVGLLAAAMLMSDDDSVQKIRGIKGIDTVVLQNLEAVLRMQAPPPPPQDAGGGGVRAAAELLTMQTDRPPDPEEESDNREELSEFELEGS